MTNRRQFIQTGLAVSAASMSLPQLLHAETGAPMLPELFIYDEGYVEAVAAARIATAQNIRVVSTHRVLTELWYDELDLRWKQTPMMLAGLTTAHGLFVFETLALDRGMRVIERAAAATENLMRWSIGPRV